MKKEETGIKLIFLVWIHHLYKGMSVSFFANHKNLFCRLTEESNYKLKYKSQTHICQWVSNSKK